MFVSKKIFLLILCLFFLTKGQAGEIFHFRNQSSAPLYWQQLPAATTHSAVDPWFSPDKGLHFLAGMMSTIAMGKSMQHFAGIERKRAFFFGAGFSISLGLAKETRDALQPGNIFSFKDLLADCLGITLGVILLRTH